MKASSQQNTSFDTCFKLIYKCRSAATTMHVLLLVRSAMAMAEYYIPIENKPYASSLYEDSTALSSSNGEEAAEYYMPVPMKSPAGAIKSLRVGKVKANPANISDILYREMADMSPELHEKITETLAHNNVDHKKYRDVFLIKKRVIDDGKRRVINFNIKERLIPKEGVESMTVGSDFGTRALLGGIMFLLAGLVFTTTLKMYQSLIKKNYLAYDSKAELYEQPQG
jgi:hypothetical protein